MKFYVEVEGTLSKWVKRGNVDIATQTSNRYLQQSIARE
jgi:hypothetical protein